MTPEEYSHQLTAAQRQLGKMSPMMRRLIRAHGDCTLSPRWRQSPYQALVRAVIYQQLTGLVAGKILDRFVVQLSSTGKFPAHGEILVASDEQLRSAGLSRQKTSYLKAIAQETATGRIPNKRSALAKLSDEDIISQFTRVRGVGRWTAEMLLIFTLGRLDVLPVDDYGVRKGFSHAAGLETMVTAKDLKQFGAQWSPYRSVAAWYLWREADIH